MPCGVCRVAICACQATRCALTLTAKHQRRCHTIMNCTKTCPKGLNPGLAIAKVPVLACVRACQGVRRRGRESALRLVRVPLGRLRRSMYLYIFIYAHTLTRTLTRTLTHTHTHTHTHTVTRTVTHTHAKSHAQSHAQSHTRTHTHTSKRTYIWAAEEADCDGLNSAGCKTAPAVGAAGLWWECL